MNDIPSKLIFHSRLKQVRLADAAVEVSDENAVSLSPPRQSSADSSRSNISSSTPVPNQVTRNQPPTTNPEAVLDTILAEFNEMESRRKQSLDDLRQLALELAIAISSKVLFRELNNEDFPFESILDSLIPEDSNEPVTVFLNPLDFQQLQKLLSENKSKLSAVNIDFKSNPQLTRGSCHVQSERFEVIRDPFRLLKQIKQEVLEIMDDASIERRTTQTANSGLQRFPDRRSVS